MSRGNCNSPTCAKEIGDRDMDIEHLRAENFALKFQLYDLSRTPGEIKVFGLGMDQIQMLINYYTTQTGKDPREALGK